jgi:hypothetical protein
MQYNIGKFMFLCPRNKEWGGGDILIYPCLFVRPYGYRYMLCPAISYSFGATALIFCMMFIHIMEVCMSTGFLMVRHIICATDTLPFFLNHS